MRRIYKNTAEEEFCKFIEAQGYIPSKRGWPDFFCFGPNGVICVEVKDTARHPLRVEQMEVMRTLKNAGMNCFVWNLEEKRLIPFSMYKRPEPNKKKVVRTNPSTQL